MSSSERAASGGKQPCRRLPVHFWVVERDRGRWWERSQHGSASVDVDRDGSGPSPVSGNRGFPGRSRPFLTGSHGHRLHMEDGPHSASRACDDGVSGRRSDGSFTVSSPLPLIAQENPTNRRAALRPPVFFTPLAATPACRAPGGEARPPASPRRLALLCQLRAPERGDSAVAAATARWFRRAGTTAPPFTCRGAELTK